MIARRRARRQPSGGAGGMTQQDLEAIRAYRTNRASPSYYRDLKAIDDKPMPAPAPANTTKE